MARPINIGSQSFEAIVSKNYFYVDKTKFIKEWWDNDTNVTVITRPRRFGKTLTLDMVKRFFSIQYHGQPEIFKGLAIYKDTNMMEKQGKYPVISLTMADCAMPTFEDMLVQLSSSIRNVFEYVETDLGLEGVRERDIAYIERILEERYDDDGNLLPLSKNMIIDSLSRLSLILYRKYSNTKVIILLDEYDAPLENAYLCGYWDKAAQFFGQFYKKTFKTNLYLGRALITGINVVPMERLSSPFNNYVSYTVTDSMYGDVFGFTQEEVDDAFWEYGLLDLREEAMQWYDGYQFGDVKDMYNPWSISIMLSKKKAAAYWFNTESNEIISFLMKNGSSDLKDQLLALMQGESVTEKIKETIGFKILRASRDTIWSLMLACGYLKVTGGEEDRQTLEIVNHEVAVMMDELVLKWFSTENDDASYGRFIESLIACDEEGMQENLSTLSLELMGSLDTAKEESSKLVENFYHGFVLGIVASTRNRFVIASNRESGKGRYDIMLEPLDKAKDNGIIIEFKVFHPEKEENLEGTCQRALKQIDDLKYDVELKKHGIPDERIVKFGIGYSGKDVLVRKKQVAR